MNLSLMNSFKVLLLIAQLQIIQCAPGSGKYTATPICQKIKDAVWCGYRHGPTKHGIKTKTSVDHNKPVFSLDPAFGINYSPASFSTRNPSTWSTIRDPYFSRHLLGKNIMCDVFSDWNGYSFPEIKEKAQQLQISEWSSQWTEADLDQKWVFLGYRGATQREAEMAAENQYDIGNGWQLFGNGLYLNPRLNADVFPTARNPTNRICYHFAPEYVMNNLLMCGLCTDSDCPDSSGSPQRITIQPKRISARTSKLSLDPDTPPSVIVYPRQVFDSIKVICTPSPEEMDQIPEPFQANTLYYDSESRQMRLHSQ